jgi:hypothetical protein
LDATTKELVKGFVEKAAQKLRKLWVAAAATSLPTSANA